MRWFLTANHEALAALERRAQAAEYINFPEVGLPPGCLPERGRIGLRVDVATGITTLYIVRGIQYTGPSKAIRTLINLGELRFRSYAGFLGFIKTDLAEAFRTIPGRRPEACARCSTRQGVPVAVDVAVSSSPSGLVPQHATSSDPLLNKLIGLVIRHVARRYGVEVEVIDSRLFPLVGSSLRSEIDQATCEAIIENILGGPIALSAVSGHTKVNLTAGPPIACAPVEEVNHG